MRSSHRENNNEITRPARSLGTASGAVRVRFARFPKNTTATNAADQPPQVSKDGLQLKVHSGTRLVYVKPGATFGKYDKVMILDCLVEFQKDWQRNYNSNVVGLDQQVTDYKMTQMKQALASEFKRIFARELEKGGYQVVATAAPTCYCCGRRSSTCWSPLLTSCRPA